MIPGYGKTQLVQSVFAAVVSLAVAGGVACSDGPSNIPTATETEEVPVAAQQGGGVAADSEMAGVMAVLPAYPGRIVSEIGAAQGPDRVGAAFYTKDTPEQVILFFEEELRAAGWVSTGPAKTTTSQPKLDGTSASGVSEEFAKPGFRLFVTAGVTYKDPSQFQTLYGLVLDRVK